MADGDSMTSRQRIETVLAGGQPDRTPVLGGWIACPEHIRTLAGVDADTYWADPQAVSIAAYRALGVDGLIGVFVPPTKDDFRIVDSETYRRADRGVSVEQAVEQIDRMPEPARIEAEFDFDAEYAAFRAGLVEMQRRCEPMVWIPAQWTAGANATWYGEFGYEAFFLLVALHPDRVAKLFAIGGAHGYCTARLVARAITEGLYPPACLFGEDICTQRGPMIDPAFLAEHYAPALAHGIAPLLDVGCRPVWHCDGDVRPILPMLLNTGIQGLQGFQPECGMTLQYIVQHRTRDGDPLLIFGPLAVTTELPVCTPEQIRRKVHDAIDICRGRADLVLFTANTINPDVPLANIVAMVEATMGAPSTSDASDSNATH